MNVNYIGRIPKVDRGITIYLGGLLVIMMSLIYPIVILLVVYFWILLILDYNFSKMEIYSEYIFVRKPSLFFISFDYKIPIEKILKISLVVIPKDGSGVLKVISEKGYRNFSLRYVNFEETRKILEKLYEIRPDLREESFLSKIERKRKEGFKVKEVKKVVPLILYLIIIFWPISIFISFFLGEILISIIWGIFAIYLGLEIWHNKIYFIENTLYIRKAKMLVLNREYEIELSDIYDFIYKENKIGKSIFGSLIIKSGKYSKYIKMRFCEKADIEKIFMNMTRNKLFVGSFEKKKSYLEGIVIFIYSSMGVLTIYTVVFILVRIEYFPIEKIIKYSIIPSFVGAILITMVFKNRTTEEQMNKISNNFRRKRIFLSDFKNNMIIFSMFFSIGLVPMINCFENSKKEITKINGEVVSIGSARGTKVLYIKSWDGEKFNISVENNSSFIRGDKLLLITKVGNLGILYDIKVVKK